MNIYLISVGHKMPAWVQQGYQDYAKRLSGDCRLQLIEIPSPSRSKKESARQIIEREGQKILARIPKHSRVIALDLKGQAWSTPELAEQMQDWMQSGQAISLLVGGAEGLSPACLKRADQSWCLSPLTFPHPLVRIIVAEQLYRAHSLLKNHPYHR